jgi:hypothetical protein
LVVGLWLESWKEMLRVDSARRTREIFIALSQQQSWSSNSKAICRPQARRLV